MRINAVLVVALLPVSLLTAQVEQFRVVQDDALVVGVTSESGFPTSPGAVSREPNGRKCSDHHGTQQVPCPDGFFVRLRTADSSIAYAT